MTKRGFCAGAAAAAVALDAAAVAEPAANPAPSEAGAVVFSTKVMLAPGCVAVKPHLGARGSRPSLTQAKPCMWGWFDAGGVGAVLLNDGDGSDNRFSH